MAVDGVGSGEERLGAAELRWRWGLGGLGNVIVGRGRFGLGCAWDGGNWAGRVGGGEKSEDTRWLGIDGT